MRKNAKTCNDYIAEISNSDGALSKELMEHCMQCRDCRQELKRQLAAADRDELPELPASLAQRVPAACRESLDWYRQPRLLRPLLYAACAAVVLWMMSLMLETAPAPSGGSHDSEAESLAADWDGRDIIEQIEWIGLAIEQIRMDMAGDWTDNDSATHVTNEE
jgi:hypothetical protein